MAAAPQCSPKEKPRGKGDSKAKKNPPQAGGASRRGEAEGRPLATFLAVVFLLLAPRGDAGTGTGCRSFPFLPQNRSAPLSPPPSSVPPLGSQPKDSVVTILIIALYHPNNKHISIINLAEATAWGQLHLLLQLAPGLRRSQPLCGRDRRDGKK